MIEIEKLFIAQIAAHIKIATCFEMVGIVIRIKETYIAHIVMRVQIWPQNNDKEMENFSIAQIAAPI